jgi:hypothetical protein
VVKAVVSLPVEARGSEEVIEEERESLAVVLISLVSCGAKLPMTGRERRIPSEAEAGGLPLTLRLC